MTNKFLNLPSETQAALLKANERKLNLMDYVLEKDLWVCQILEVLFSMPYNMVFKGGTSLSKGYSLIKRFSEDVDITIDYRHFRDPIDLDSLSRSQLKKISSELKLTLRDFVNKSVVPYLYENLKQAFKNIDLKMEVSDNGEQLKIYYNTVLGSSLGYIRDHVLLEFGVRNEIEPQEKRVIKPYITDFLGNDITVPMPTVDTLSPIRTYWEKATLIHVECQRDKLLQSPDRLSRHWYDLYVLNQSWVAKKALDRNDVLKKVIKHKTAFFNSSYANYESCLSGKFRLIPNTLSLKGLEDDYKRMCSSGMFVGDPPAFIDIIHSLSNFEKELNSECCLT